MARARRGRRIAALGLAGLLAACAAADRNPAGLTLSFEDHAEPEVFAVEGPARRDRTEGAEGFWATVDGLPRPERARVVNLETGAEVVVALFRGGRAGEIRLSGEAADALGIGDAPVRVQVTALRRAAVIAVGDDAF